MNSASTPPSSLSDEFWLWFGFWAQFVLLGLAAAIGGLYGGHSDDPDDATCGLLLMIAAIALAFPRLEHHFDGRPMGWGSALLVDDMPNLWLAIVVFAFLGLLGLITGAEAEEGALHNAGVALFVVAALAILLNMKRVFDNLERPGLDRPRPEQHEAAAPR